MHELSMAQGILNAVLDTAEANDAIRVTDMIIEIGKLAMLNPEQLKFMLGVLCKDTIAEDANKIFQMPERKVSLMLMTVIIMHL